MFEIIDLENANWSLKKRYLWIINDSFDQLTSAVSHIKTVQQLIRNILTTDATITNQNNPLESFGIAAIRIISQSENS